jgi:hypothetical protein
MFYNLALCLYQYKEAWGGWVYWDGIDIVYV